MSWWWLAGCASLTLAPTEDPPASARMYLDGPAKSGSVLVVQTVADAEVQLDLTEPWGPGVELREDGEARVEVIGEQTVTTRRWRYIAPQGSYELAPLVGEYTNPDGSTGELSVPGLFLDIGTAPEQAAQLVDIAEPDEVWTMPWGLVGGGGLLLGLVVAGVFFAGRVGRERTQITEVAPEPPHVVALRAWDAVRADPTLDDHARAVAVAQIFRTYAEAVLGFPATAATTPEILERLATLRHLPEGNVPRARRLLRATDRVKFAGEQGTSELFEDLDADLRAFVAGTRPHSWADEEAS